MSQEALQRFLEQAGGTVESTAEFGLDPAKALSKLAGHQLLLEPGLWIVKMVQGAVAGQASRVEIILNRDCLEFRCYGGNQVRAHELLGQVLSGELPSERQTSHWVTALRSAYGKQPLRLAWSSWQGDLRETALIEPTGVSLTTSHERGEGDFHLLVVYPRRWSWSSVWADEYASLCQRCRFCTLELTVDSRLISRQPPDRQRRGGYHWATWLEPGLSEDAPAFPLYTGQDHDPPTKTPPIKIAEGLYPSGLHRCAMLLCVSPSESRSYGARVSWIRDGALVGPLALVDGGESMDLEVFLPGDHLQTDLSEWALRGIELELGEASPRILATLRNIADTLERCWIYPMVLDHAIGAKILRLGTIGGFVGLLLVSCACNADLTGGATFPEFPRHPHPFRAAVKAYAQRPLVIQRQR